jgi:uncharacterized protein (DUF1330 family)
MKTKYAVALAVATGFGLGAIAIQGLHAQAKPPIYVVNELEVTDQSGFKTYAEHQAVLIKKNGGRYIVRGGKVTAIEGTTPKRSTIYVFDSMDKFQAWRAESEQKELMVSRDKVAKFTSSYAVEGLGN